MVSRSHLSDTEKSALAKVAVEPQTVGTLPSDEAALLIDRNMMEEVMGHYVITPKGQLELRRHVYRRSGPRDGALPGRAPDDGQHQMGTSMRPAPLSQAQSSRLRSFWTWLQGANNSSRPDGR